MAAVTPTAGGPEAEAVSLRGELCCVDTDPGLRPFTGQGSPGGYKAREEIGRVRAEALLLQNMFSLLTEAIYLKAFFKMKVVFQGCMQQRTSLPPAGILSQSQTVCHVTGVTLV